MSEPRKHWWSGWTDATDPQRDVKLAGFGAVVVAAIVWLTREQSAKGITDQWVNAFYGLCALVGLGGAAMMAVDKIKGRTDAPATPAPQGTEAEKGEGQ